MAKDAYYFSHDSNARNDEKIIAVRMKYGVEGYGAYFMILERLMESTNYTHVKDYNTIAFDLRVGNTLIKSIVEDFGLFEFTEDGKHFYSESFKRRMRPLDNLREQRSLAGKKSAEKRALLNKESTTVERPLNEKATKERKGKESKIISTNVDIPESEKQASRTHIDYKKIVEFFNSETKGVFGIVRYPLSPKRQESIRARIREHGEDAFVEMVRKAALSEFLKGNNKRGFQATFDWLIRPSNFQKTLEGNYDNRNKENKRSATDIERIEWLAREAEEAFSS